MQINGPTTPLSRDQDQCLVLCDVLENPFVLPNNKRLECPSRLLNKLGKLYMTPWVALAVTKHNVQFLVCRQCERIQENAEPATNDAQFKASQRRLVDRTPAYLDKATSCSGLAHKQEGVSTRRGGKGEMVCSSAMLSRRKKWSARAL